jgi:hypothetical protein
LLEGVDLVPMRPRQIKKQAPKFTIVFDPRNRLRTDYKQAASLLRHDLVWSEDFDAIRQDLADLIDFYANADHYPSAMTEIVRNLIATENDLTI